MDKQLKQFHDMVSYYEIMCIRQPHNDEHRENLRRARANLNKELRYRAMHSPGYKFRDDETGQFYRKPKAAYPDFNENTGYIAVMRRWEKYGRKMDRRNIRRRERYAEKKALKKSGKVEGMTIYVGRL